MLRLRVDKNKCTNCRFCELACAFTHYRRTVLKDSRIAIIQRAVEDQSYTINVCHQCSLCPPLDVCPAGALTRDARTGVVHLNGALCPPGCRLCVPACPLGAILEGTAGLILCDFCAGDPACVQVCYTEALFVREYALTPRGLGKHGGTPGGLAAGTPGRPMAEGDQPGIVAFQPPGVPASGGRA